MLFILCICPLVKRDNFPIIWRTVSLLAKPQSALQLNVRIESASVIGVLTVNKLSKLIIPLLKRTQFHILLRISSPHRNDFFLALPTDIREIEPPIRLIGPQTQLMITLRADRWQSGSLTISPEAAAKIILLHRKWKSYQNKFKYNYMRQS